ncbi:MAG: endonuclease [Acidimicrobiaceae bacterium]|jgi:endonuclease-8
MPEGDTIHRTANRLRPVLVGRPLVKFDAPRAAGKRPTPGTTIDAVEAVGKHLLIRFAGGVTLRTHMRMTGSWHLYRTGERWKKPAHLARAIVEVEGWTAVCFAAPVVQLETNPGADASVAHLGPDLTSATLTDADIERAVDRMTDGEIGVVLLDQRVASGIGNIWKNETLFLCGVDPFRAAAELDRDTKRALIATASKLLRASVRDAPRPGNVYGRARRPCRRCGTPIRTQRQGDQARTAYWCPTCQK